MEYTSSQFITGVVWLSIMVPFVTFTLAKLFQFRNVYIIKARGVTTIIVLNFAFLLSFIFVCGNYLLTPRESQPCGSGAIFAPLLNLIFTLCVLRVWVLVFRFRIAQKLATISAANSHAMQTKGDMGLSKMYSYRELLEGEGSWFVRHRHLITRPYRFLMFSTSMLICIGLALLAGFYPGDVTCLQQRNVVTYVVVFVIVVNCACLLVITRFLRAEDADAFGIRRELRAMAIVAFLALVVEVPPSMIARDRLSVEINNMTNIALFFAWLVTNVWPLWLCYRISPPKPVDFEGLHDVATLEDLLSIDIGFKSFTAYTQREFAQENVMFWRAAKAFSATWTKADYTALLNWDDCIKEANELARQFIFSGAPSEVNISAPTRASLIENLVRLQHWSHASPVPIDGPTSTAVHNPNAHLPTSASQSIVIGPPPGAQPHEIQLALLSDLSPSAAVVSTSSASQRERPLPAFAVVPIFKQAIDEVYGLMITDLLPRYLTSAEFVAFVSSMKQRAAERAVIKQEVSSSSQAAAKGPNSTAEEHSKSSNDNHGTVDRPQTLVAASPSPTAPHVLLTLPGGVKRKASTSSPNSAPTSANVSPSRDASHVLRLDLTLGTHGDTTQFVDLDHLEVDSEAGRVIVTPPTPRENEPAES